MGEKGKKKRWKTWEKGKRQRPQNINMHLQNVRVITKSEWPSG